MFGNVSIETENPVRTESNREAVTLAGRSPAKIWQQHLNFVLIHHNHSFVAKLLESL